MSHRKAMIIACALVALSITPTSIHAEPPKGVVVATEDWAEIPYAGRYLLLNNVWNKQAAKGKHAQRIFAGADNVGGTVGWDWEWKGSDRWVLAFPEIGCGDSPWVKGRGFAPDFPFRVGAKKVTVTIDATIEAEGRLNMSFQIWAISRLPNVKENITREIMIWVYDKSPGDWAWATKRGNVTSGGVIFDVYEKTGHGDDSGAHSNRWAYTSFVARTPILKGTVKIHEFLEYMVNNGMLTMDEFITNVDLGNEIWYGKGTTTLRAYDVKVQDAAE